MAAFDQYIYLCTIILIVANLLFGADDLFIDLYAWIKRLKVKTINQIDFIKMNCADEKPLAIMVASWKEKHVLTRMVQGNSKRVLYSNVHFFLGVYPNDEATLLEAKELAATYPNVHVVINTENGPTSKGQMINEIVYGIFAKEQELKLKFASMIIHDSEDLIHPYSLKLINSLLENYSFIQIPIFSLPVSPKELVAGIYMDEFAESHLKDLLVRQDMGVAIPSAGVGTALSRQLVEHYLKVQSGMLLNPLTVTEDYELGVKTKRYGFKSTFACYNLENSKDATIATREYFPKKFIRSIRQKSRWVLGITFQGTEFLGWSGSFKERYFLFRDRKGPTANMFVLFGMVAFMYSLVRMQMDSYYSAGFLKFTDDHGINPTLVISLMGVNVLFMVNRLFQRGYFSYVLYGWKTLPFLVIRVLLGNVINSAASIKACNQYIVSKITGEAPKWIKTEHELPVGFGSDEVDNISHENQTTTA